MYLNNVATIPLGGWKDQYVSSSHPDDIEVDDILALGVAYSITSVIRGIIPAVRVRLSWSLRREFALFAG